VKSEVVHANLDQAGRLGAPDNTLFERALNDARQSGYNINSHN
jgi:hypothetical protein